jgi:DNA mismatch repair protein MutS
MNKNVQKSAGELTPLMKQYWNIKSQHPKAVLFFRLGDFYEMFADDAIKISPILEVVLTQKAGVPMCGVPHHSVNSYIKKVISKGFKVAVCEQLEESAVVKKGIVNRGVTRIITPGTLLEDDFLDSKKNNFLMSIVFSESDTSVASYAIADISTGEFFTSKTTLKFVENEVLKYEPSEIITPAVNNTQDERISNLKSITKSYVSSIDISFFDFYNAKKIISEIIGCNYFKKSEFDKKEIVCACGALLSYVKKMHPQSVNIFSDIRYIKNSDFMYLDAVTIKTLELTNSLTKFELENSLLFVIDSTKTPMGARTMRQWIIKPLLDVYKIKNRQNTVKFFLENSDIRKKTLEKLKAISDLERIVARIYSNTATPKDLVSLKNSLNTISDISKIIKFTKELNIELPKNIIQIVDKIALYLSEEAPASLKDGSVIKSNINVDLDNLRKISMDTKNYISNIEIKERIASGISNLKIGYTSVFGYYIEVSKSNISRVPSHYLRKQTIVNGERFITEELKTFEERLLSSQEKILRLECEIFNTLRQEISFFATDILNTARIVSEIDILCSFAVSALEYGYVCPKVSNGSELSIKGGRHPVVERILKNGEFTPNDIVFGKNLKIMILTGPNMSGKSTYLRQVALIVIMAQIGSFVPACSAEIGIIDRIFTRIGSGDNLAGGESTFMVEMIETANILNQYTKRSLIIFDEVGRGTSTYDGMSIAWAIIEFLANDIMMVNVDVSGAKILFATHYFELTNLSKTLKGVINYSVSVKEWNEKIIFLHKIVKGSAEKSYGIYVAKVAGMPNQIIERAYKILKNLEIRSSESTKHENTGIEVFCNVESQILTELKNINLVMLSPMEAFSILRNWKKKCR